MAAAVSMYSGANLNPNAFQNASWMAKAASQIEAGAFDTGWYPGNQCSGQSVPNMNLLKTSSGIALSVGGAATGIMVATSVISATTGAIVGAATLGIGALISVIGMIFAHHAAAVARDVNFACGAIPAVNNAFQVIAAGVKAGQITPANAAAALDTVYSQFMAAGGASSPTSIPDSGAAINKHPWCNANCEMSVILKGMVLYWQAIYNGMTAAVTSATPTGSVPTSTAPLSTGMPSAGTLVPLNSSPAAALTSGSLAQPVPGSGPSFTWIAAAAVAAFLLFT